MQILSKNNDTNIEIFKAKVTGLAILDALGKQNKLIKTANTNIDADNVSIQTLKLLASILDKIGIENKIKLDDLQSITKEASKKINGENDQKTIMIASKRQNDSHYYFDISKDNIQRNGKSLIMVSFFMREGYLGRYLIKRNYYYLPNNEQDANETFGELSRKADNTKKRYLNETIAINGIFPEVKSFLDGIKGDFEFKEDVSLGTTPQADQERGHTVNGPYYITNGNENKSKT